MIVNIANHEFPYSYDNVYYFALSDYPNISDWELKKLILLIDYEKKHGRQTEIVCDNENIISVVNYALANPESFLKTERPKRITECTACKQGGCLTDYLCHTTSNEKAKMILKCGKILSAVKAKSKSGEELEKEPENAAKDPPDFFEYVMLAWGNCQAGDRIVMERMLRRFPDENDLSVGFKPGVRFYFKFDSISAHEGFIIDGREAAKVKDEIELTDYLCCCIIPKQYEKEYVGIIPPLLAGKVVYVENDCKDIWDWSEKVYNLVCEKHSYFEL